MDKWEQKFAKIEADKLYGIANDKSNDITTRVMARAEADQIISGIYYAVNETN